MSECFTGGGGKLSCVDTSGMLTVTTQLIDWGAYMGGVQTMVTANTLTLPYGKTFGDIDEMFMKVSALGNVTQGIAREIILRWDAATQRFYSFGRVESGPYDWSSVIVSGLGTLTPVTSYNPIPLSAKSVQNIGVYNNWNNNTWILPLYQLLNVAIVFK